jgi:hypothetical protein
MAGIAGRGTTYNLPNYHGQLIALSRESNPFLAAIGGLLGGLKTVDAKEWEWQGYDLRAPAINRQRLEGADAPTADNRVRQNFSNITEIHQEAVDVSYTRMAAVGQRNGLNVAQDDPAINEVVFQTSATVKAKARDINATFIRGTYNKPTDNTTARRTRGLLEAITTNRKILAPGRPLVYDDLGDLMQMAWDAGGFREGETRTLMLNSIPKRQLTKVFVKDAGYKEETRNVGGMNLQTVETDFGRVNLMLEPDMPQTAIAAVSLEVCKPVALEIPQKGVFFLEPLAKIGASERSQLYGEIGLEYGSEVQHAVLDGITVPA